jgi:hypothetical protein
MLLDGDVFAFLDDDGVYPQGFVVQFVFEFELQIILIFFEFKPYGATEGRVPRGSVGVLDFCPAVVICHPLNLKKERGKSNKKTRVFRQIALE